ncbi:MAG TPA: protein kinase [Kofleriaceae bacterium]|nr:protein kinase [Kofleriaceae bacterium]
MEQPAANDPLIGANVGNYRVVQKLGEGGMGSVYLAEHPLIGKKVALKVLHAELSSNEDVTTRFFNEAKAVNDIQHPNIVDIIDYGTIDNASSPGHHVVYFIMEFLDGVSLADTVRTQAPLEVKRTLHICHQIADCLAASHRNSIVHRDLKPDNIILVARRSTKDFVKVLDFGIAKLTGEHHGSRRTRTGIVMGTPAYMSPEQCEGRGQIDHRTDIYSLGILLYECLTGRVPFVGVGYGEVLVQHLTQSPPPPSSLVSTIPPHVEAVCLKALQKDPGARYATMEDFMAALDDPEAYVESHGGLAGFLDSGATVVPVHADASQRYQAFAPGDSPARPPAYAAKTVALPAPVEGAGPGAAAPGNRSKTLIIAGIAAVILVAGGLIAFAMSGSETPVAETDNPVMVSSGGHDVAPVTTPPPVIADAAPAIAEPEKPEPEVIPEPAKPEKVEIVINSDPDGARIYVNGSHESIGTTPYVYTVEKSKKPIKVVLRLARYHTEADDVIPNRDRELNIALKRRQRQPHKDPNEDIGIGVLQPHY